jgi:hypothetical protein
MTTTGTNLLRNGNYKRDLGRFVMRWYQVAIDTHPDHSAIFKYA